MKMDHGSKTSAAGSMSWMRRVYCAVALVGLAGSIVIAQPKDDGPIASPATTVFMAEHVDLDKALIDPRDQGVRKALRLVPARLNELPVEIGDAPQAVPELINLLGKMLFRHGRLAIQWDPKVQGEGNPTGLGVQVSMDTAGDADAKGLEQAVKDLLGNLPEEPPPIEVVKDGPFAGMSALESPGGLIRWGLRKGDAGTRWELNFGSPAPMEKIFSPMTPIKTAINGPATPFMRFSFDAAPLEPLIKMVEQNFGENADAARGMAMLKQSGVGGEFPIRIDMALAHTERGTVSYTVTKNAGKLANAAGMKDPLTDADLAIVPADAYAAMVTKVSLKAVVDQLNTLIAENPEVSRQFAKIKKDIGVDPINDIVGSLGSVFAVYRAESTGGPSLGGGVLVAQLSDAKRFSGAMGTLTKFSNTMLADRKAARGYVAVREWSHDGVALQSLQFPGLPVPLEVTWAFSDQWFVVGLNPQAVIGGVRQVSGKGDKGLMSRPEVAALYPAGVKFQSVGYMDTVFSLRDGYPLLSMAGSALGNAVRTPKGSDAAREVGLIVPTFKDLSKGVKPAVQFTYWNGDDMVQEWHADKSLLVNVGAAIGEIKTLLPVIAGVAALGGAAQWFEPRRNLEVRHEEEPVEVAKPIAPNFMIIPGSPMPVVNAKDLLNTLDALVHNEWLPWLTGSSLLPLDQ